MSIFGKLPAALAPKAVTIDIAEMFSPTLPESHVITWKKLSVPDLYEAGQSAAVLRRDFPDAPLTLCQNVTQMALAHQSPLPAHGEPSVKWFYMNLALEHGDLYIRLLERFMQEFPELNGGGDLDSKKQD